MGNNRGKISKEKKKKIIEIVVLASKSYDRGKAV